MRWFFELVSSKTQYDFLGFMFVVTFIYDFLGFMFVVTFIYDFLGFMFVVTFIYTFLELEKVQVGYVSVACL